jgi:predicted DCC family thiol-disulfide oxidoreductase YuxK
VADPLKTVARLGAHVVAAPVRALARVRPPAIEDPTGLKPGDAPPTDGRLLLLYDGGCGICLHARDVFATLDRRGRLVHDHIARYDSGLLADMDEDTRYGSWHAVYPDGRVESGAKGVVAALSQLPFGRLPGRIVQRFPDQADQAYQWFADNRSWISQGSGLINHPERDPREQPGEPGHDEVVL